MAKFARTPDQLGQIIRRYRLERELSQADLAQATGRRQATISEVESGARTTQIDTIFDILTAMKLELVVRPRAVGTPADIEELF